jgi:hypothetical protein
MKFTQDHKIKNIVLNLVSLEYTQILKPLEMLKEGWRQARKLLKYFVRCCHPCSVLPGSTERTLFK